jgi:hypothetical protein
VWSGRRPARVLAEVDRSTTERNRGLWPDEGMDKTARQRPGGHRLEAIQDLAKVRVAGSNPVVRSKKVLVRALSRVRPGFRERPALPRCATTGRRVPTRPLGGRWRASASTTRSGGVFSVSAGMWRVDVEIDPHPVTKGPTAAVAQSLGGTRMSTGAAGRHRAQPLASAAGERRHPAGPGLRLAGRRGGVP